MCGIVGYLDDGRRHAPLAARAILRRMSTCLAHRGPDDEGCWTDDDVGLALGHRRLSILDLSPEGHQPMTSVGGRYVTVFNGEVYNWRQMRTELERVGRTTWRGHSDTEVLLAGFEQWGLRGTLDRANGMFAIAVWDRGTKRLHLCRDRLGEKPLYYGWSRGVFLFGSELKGLRAHPAWDGTIDRGALTSYVRFGYVPSPNTIHAGMRKVPPGTVITLDAGASAPRGDAALSADTFWSVRDAARAAAAAPFTGSPTEAVSALDALLRDAVALRSYADVPVGAFLSGGVDSSTVVALMQAQANRPVKTFSIGFHEGAFDEARHARAVAAHLGTEHQELYVTAADALAVVPRLPTMFDEPFADSSQIPTFLVAQLARREVTVTLSGDGGDELFAGYNRHQWNRRLWRRLRWLPAATRTLAARGIAAVPSERWDRLLAGIARPLGMQHPGGSVHKLASVLGARDPDDLYARLVSKWSPADAIVLGATHLPSAVDDEQTAFIADMTERMMVIDLLSYLPDDILVKVDRASMAVSLESRVPMLDHRVVELALRLPLDVKLRDGSGKWVLRQVLDRYVPRTLIERPKSGFAIPLAAWLCGPLRDWAEHLLDERRLRQEGWFDAALVRRQWTQHVRGTGDHEHRLWVVLMFQAWLETQ